MSWYRHKTSNASLLFQRSRLPNAFTLCNTLRFHSVQCNVRTRYAPSPTGSLHLGGLRTALFNYLYARKMKGEFILRIEDTDKRRMIADSAKSLMSSLHWCGIQEDEGPMQGGPFAPYVQSQRLETYRAHAECLIHNGHAYRCFCTPERLAKLREKQLQSGSATMYDRACLQLSVAEIDQKLEKNEPYTIRLLVPSGKTVVKDLLRGYIPFSHSTLDDQILIKTDGFPTYHLANVIDDHLMKITHVIRGEEWLPSTPKHVLLYRALGFTEPQFGHLGLLLNEDRSKLSKRKGDMVVADFEKSGYLPSALINFVALLGWNPAAGCNKEIYTFHELEQEFSLENINKGGSIVNIDRLCWINSQHIRSLFDPCQSKAKAISTIMPYFDSISPLSGEEIVSKFGFEYVWNGLFLMKERVQKLADFVALCLPFFLVPDLSTEYAQRMKAKHVTESIHQALFKVRKDLEALSDEEFVQKGSIMARIQKVAKEENIGLKAILMPIRYYITGLEVGASIEDTLHLIGREETRTRLVQHEVDQSNYSGLSQSRVS